MELYRLACPDRGTVVAERLQVARSFFSRLKGLLGRNDLPQGEGLYIVPCDSIHMIGMKFPIDAVWVDAQLRVLEVTADLAVGRLASHSGADGVMELPAGTAARCGIVRDDRLTLEKSDGHPG